MAGATRNQVRIVTDLGTQLSLLLQDKDCHVYTSDLRLGIVPADLYTYPDLVVTCGQEQTLDNNTETLLNPACNR